MGNISPYPRQNSSHLLHCIRYSAAQVHFKIGLPAFWEKNFMNLRSLVRGQEWEWQQSSCFILGTGSNLWQDETEWIENTQSSLDPSSSVLSTWIGEALQSFRRGSFLVLLRDCTSFLHVKHVPYHWITSHSLQGNWVQQSFGHGLFQE